MFEALKVILLPADMVATEVFWGEGSSWQRMAAREGSSIGAEL